MSSVTLATEKDYVRINLRGSGRVKIDWKDGKSETPTLSASGFTYSHNYASSNIVAHEIYIVALEDGIITGLACDCNELIGTLDVSSLSNLGHVLNLRNNWVSSKHSSVNCASNNNFMHLFTF